MMPTSPNSQEWGWIGPDGKVVKQCKTKLKAFTHREMTESNGLPAWSAIFQRGYVRYSIGFGGDAMFHFVPRLETRERVIQFIRSTPIITDKIHLDLGSFRSLDEVEVLPTPDEAIEFLQNFST